MSRRNTYFWLFICAIVCAGVVVGGLVIANQLHRIVNPYLDSQITGPITITSQWQDVRPDQPLRPERKTQYVVLEVADTLNTPNPSVEPTLPDGSTVTIQVQLIDQKGVTYELTSPAGDNRTQIWRGMGIEKSQALPDGTVFDVVRIRSSHPIRCSRIIWRSYDPRDFK
jgi:hypothetical protein